MRIPWRRGAIGLLLAEAVPILILVLAVALFGPRESGAAAAYANRLGRWIGPIAGGLCVLLFSWWVAKAGEARRVGIGFGFGCLAALLDAGLLVASDAPFELLFVGSNLGRVAAGTVGGLLAARKGAGVAGA